MLPRIIISLADMSFSSAHVMQVLKQINASSGLTLTVVVVGGSNISTKLSSCDNLMCFFEFLQTKNSNFLHLSLILFLIDFVCNRKIIFRTHSSVSSFSDSSFIVGHNFFHEDWIKLNETDQA
ncbi:hypothetical protein HHI36_015510 [Cryptolaemus montrouzieri]|uniref:Uncharacterized protein n=1 Tax=Cryptolaemus montrouzieri TaxID=559131 RepID=A0ABD2N6C0_9CUCU